MMDIRVVSFWKNNISLKPKTGKEVFPPKWPVYFLDFLLIGLLPVFVLTIIEIMNRDNFTNYLIWFQESTKIWFLNYLILISVYAMLYVLPRKWFYGMSIFTSTIFLLFGLINRTVMQLKGDPLTPFDLMLFGEATDIAKAFDLEKTVFFVVVLLLVTFATTILFLKKLRKTKFQPIPHLLVYTFGVFLSISLFNQWPTTVYAKFHVRNKNVNPLVNTTLNGFILHFALEIKDVKVEKPEPISKNEMITKLQTFQQQANEKANRPNVIFWMGEAFWDLTESPVLHFSKDPLAFFHQMQKEHIAGKLLVKARGGHTANTEFEIVTGSSMNFLPDHSVPYNQYLHSSIDSLANVFSQNGYYTTAIHPYNSWYYNRSKVYQQMGFNHYVSGEFFHNPQKIAGRISDQTFVESILTTMKDTKQQDFIYAISMQNHAPYDNVQPNPAYTVSGEINERQALFMGKYISNLHDTDQALKKLIDGIEKTAEPTIIILFGDHLPSINEALKTRRNDLPKFFPDANTAYKQYLLAYQTPLLIWDNCGYDKKELSLSSSYLGAYVLQMLHQKREPYWHFLYQIFQKHPILPTSEFYKQAGINEKELTFYKQLQYDRLFGEKVTVKQQNLDKPSFFLGFKRQRITAVQLMEKKENRSVYKISGQGFSNGGMNNNPTKVWVNNKEVQSISVKPEEILFQVSGDVQVKNVQTKNFDNRNRLITASNRFTILKN